MENAMKIAAALTAHYCVFSIRNNAPHPFAFDNKAEALEFYDSQVCDGWVYVTLWHFDGETYHPCDPEAVRKNLKTEGIWL